MAIPFNPTTNKPNHIESPLGCTPLRLHKRDWDITFPLSITSTANAKPGRQSPIAGMCIYMCQLGRVITPAPGANPSASRKRRTVAKCRHAFKCHGWPDHVGIFQTSFKRLAIRIPSRNLIRKNGLRMYVWLALSFEIIKGFCSCCGNGSSQGLTWQPRC